jgi:hypothetical protein
LAERNLGIEENVCLVFRVARWPIFVPKFGFILECLGMKNIGTFYGHVEKFTAYLVYFMAIE